MDIYIVQAGDTIDRIASSYGIEVSAIIYANQMIYPYKLAIGQALVIPLGKRKATRISYIKGYAYPFISQEVLEQTLPYLSDLSIFSYGFTTTGELIPPKIEEQWLISKAWQTKTLPIMTLTPLDEKGNFNNYLITSVVNDIEIRTYFIENILYLVKTKGYAGVDVDFEYIRAQDKDAFSEFVKELTIIMNKNGYQVSVALAPKSSNDQVGLLYEGKDYKALGEAANYVLLMTYEWGYTYGPPMAVAPIHLVEEVVKYAITEIVPEKILLGIPNYGYDWTLPFEKGNSKAKTLGNIEAIALATEKGSSIQYDKQAQSPYFKYWEEGYEHEVWFEDARSMQAKMDLIHKYHLLGGGIWQIMRLFRPMNLVIKDNFYIQKFE